MKIKILLEWLDLTVCPIWLSQFWQLAWHQIIAYESRFVRTALPSVISK